MPDSASRPPEVTRRRALQFGAVAAGSLAAIGRTGAAAGAESRAVTAPGRLERSFDEDWLFYRGDASGAEAVSFDDSGWRALDLPHDWSIEDLPYATSEDGAATDDPSLLVYLSGAPPEPTPPQVIGPFDENGSAGGGGGGDAGAGRGGGLDRRFPPRPAGRPGEAVVAGLAAPVHRARGGARGRHGRRHRGHPVRDPLAHVLAEVTGAGLGRPGRGDPGDLPGQRRRGAGRRRQREPA